jgi:hypothetical protein
MPIRPEHAPGVCDARQAQRHARVRCGRPVPGSCRASTDLSPARPPAGGADPLGRPIPAPAAPATLVIGGRPGPEEAILQPRKELR